MQWTVRVVIALTFAMLGAQLGFAEKKVDKKAMKLLDDAIEAWYENIDAVGDYVVEYEGNLVKVEDDRHFVTDFSGRTMRRGDKIRTERVVKYDRRTEFPIRAGILYDGSDKFVIEGFHDDSVLRKVRRDKPERIRHDFEVDPFYLIPGGIDTGGTTSVFRSRTHHLHSMEPVNVFQIELGVAAVFKSKTPNYYRIIRFNRNLGWMPDLSDAGTYYNKDSDAPPDGDDLRVSYSHRLIWKELRTNVFVPVFYERTSPKYNKTTQVAFDWTNHDRAEAEFFTPAHLESSHRMQDFAFTPVPVLRPSILGGKLKDDWVPIDDDQ